MREAIKRKKKKKKEKERKSLTSKIFHMLTFSAAGGLFFPMSLLYTNHLPPIPCYTKVLVYADGASIYHSVNPKQNLTSIVALIVKTAT